LLIEHVSSICGFSVLGGDSNARIASCRWNVWRTTSSSD
jgi:hypothetical protein